MRKAQKADRLLARRDLTGLLTAQAAEQSGDSAQAFEAYKALLPDDRTRAVGIQGLMRLKLEEGDTDAAMALAKKAFALRPDNESILRTLFDLQSKSGDWSGARETLTASMHARMLPRDVGVRRDAVLSLADARAALAEGDTARGNEAALQANKLAPTLVPAAALAARVQAERGQKRKATKILTTAWAAHPNPSSPPPSPRSSRTRPRRPSQALRDAGRRQPGEPREPPARGRARARRRGLPRRPQGARRPRRRRADHAEPRADGRDRARQRQVGRRRARLARQGARRLARAAVDLHQVQPRQRHLGPGLRELRRLRHPRLAHAVARRGLAPRRTRRCCRSSSVAPPRRRSPSPPRRRLAAEAGARSAGLGDRGRRARERRRPGPAAGGA